MKAIIFDMDGVLIDSEPLNIEAEIDIMKSFGVDIDISEMERFTGVTNTSMWKTLKSRYNLEMSVEALVVHSNHVKKQKIRQMDIKPIDGIEDLINYAISKGYKLGVASSSPMDMIQLVINKFGLMDAFHVLVSGEEVKNSKPAPDVFLKAISLLGVMPKDCFVIEDSTHGVAAAKAAGVTCIGFDNPNSVGQVYEMADFVVASIPQILKDKIIT